MRRFVGISYFWELGLNIYLYIFVVIVIHHNAVKRYLKQEYWLQRVYRKFEPVTLDTEESDVATV